MKKFFSIFYAAFFVLIFCAANVSAQDVGVKICGYGALNDKAVNLVKPAYPPAARAVRARGVVNVQVMVDEKGNIISAKAVSGHPLLRMAAENAALQSKLTPTLLQEKPVKISGILVFNFPLEDSLKTDDAVNKKPVVSKTNDNILNEKAIKLPLPVYPAAAKAVGASGTVTVRVIIDEQGNVVSAKAESGHPLLLTAAETAARQAKFSPAMSSGKSDEVSGMLIYNFPPK
ncbi:MAG: TonB family protein [Pyrinomonadaceae bacterium]